LHFVIRRIGAGLATLFLVSAFSFLAFSVIPGDPASMMLGINATDEQVAALREEMGLNRSLPDRYFRWLGGFLGGNPGNSLRYAGEGISTLVLDRLPVSFFLALLSIFFILIIAVPVSLFTVRREDSLAGRAVTVGTAIGVSIPNFFLGVLFIWIFGIGLRLFSAGTYVGYRENFFAFAGCLLFPALAIAIPNAAILTKFLRSSLFRELRSGYVRTALGKGAAPAVALRRHALRNALVPSVTVLGMIIADVFSGSIVIEQVFAIPGLGRLLIAAITSRDYPLIQALVMYTACVVILVNTLVDIAIQVIDPRIRLEREAH